MNTEKQASAKALYFQTSLSASQIAEVLHIPRRTIHHWIRENNWQRIRQSATVMPSLLAEHCYHMFDRLSVAVLSEDRIMQPVTHKEADTLHKLVLTANKMKNRATLNENLERLGFFMESVNKESPEMATAISPFVDRFIAKRAAVNMSQLMPEHFNEIGFIPKKEKSQEEIRETQLDIQDIMDWTSKDTTIVDIEQFRSKADPTPDNPPADYFTAPQTAAPQEPTIVSADADFSKSEAAPVISGADGQNVAEAQKNATSHPVILGQAEGRRAITGSELEQKEFHRTLEKYRDHTGQVDLEKFLEDTLALYQPAPKLETAEDFLKYQKDIDNPQRDQNSKAA